MARTLLALLLVVSAASLPAAELGRPFGPEPAWAHPEPGDVDGDGVLDQQDNCPEARNADQRNSDGDGRAGADAAGDACDDDDDADGLADPADNCRIDFNPDQRDADGRADADGVGDACEGDGDGDGVTDARDSCRDVANAGQEDADLDALGDPCDPDDDDDGVFDERDNCPRAANPAQADADADGRGPECDSDGDAGPLTGTDRTPPRISYRVAAPARLAAIGAGVPVLLRCSEACAMTARLILDRRRTARWGLPSAVVAAGSAQIAAAGKTYAFMRFKRRARRVLFRQRRVRLTLRIKALDPGSNTRSVTGAVVLRR